MKKLLSSKILIAVLISMFLLTACANNQVEIPEPTTSPPTELPTAAVATEVPTLPATETVAVIPTETTAPTETETIANDGQVSFANDVFPIIEIRCFNCHGGERIEEGLNLTSYAGVMAGSVNGAVVVAGDAENSLLIEMVATQKMPKRGVKLTPAQVQIFRDWVNLGALNN